MVGSAAGRAFSALADSRRRRILLQLLEHGPDEDVPVPDGVEFEAEPGETLELAMYHRHLPRLAESGYVAWDPDNSTVRQGPNFGEIRPLLEILDRHGNELPDGWM